MKSVFTFILALCAAAFLLACQTAPSTDPKTLRRSQVRCIALTSPFLTPTNFILTPKTTRKEQSPEIGDIVSTITKPLRAPPSALWDPNRDIREQVKPQEAVSSVLSARLPLALARAGGKRWQLAEEGQPVDATLLFYASEMGFLDDAYNSLFRTVAPRVVFQAILYDGLITSFRTNYGIYNLSRGVMEGASNQVLWKTNFTVARSDRWLFLPGSSRDAYIRHPEKLRKSLEAISRSAADQLAAELNRALKSP